MNESWVKKERVHTSYQNVDNSNPKNPKAAVIICIKLKFFEIKEQQKNSWGKIRFSEKKFVYPLLSLEFIGFYTIDVHQRFNSKEF